MVGGACGSCFIVFGGYLISCTISLLPKVLGMCAADSLGTVFEQKKIKALQAMLEYLRMDNITSITGLALWLKRTSHVG